MNKVVMASSQQIFGLLLSLGIISGLTNMFVAVAHLPNIIGVVVYVIYVTCSIGWILLTGTSLELKKYGVLSRPSYKAFIFVGVLLITAVSMTRLSSQIDEIMSNPVIQVVFMIYMFASIFWLASFTAKSLKSNETNEEIDINDYFGDIFRIVFWPIGVWTIQARVNKIFRTIDKVTNDERP
jgi:hypothetical protein